MMMMMVSGGGGGYNDGCSNDNVIDCGRDINADYDKDDRNTHTRRALRT